MTLSGFQNALPPKRKLPVLLASAALALTTAGCTHMYQSLQQAPKDAEHLDSGMHAVMARNDWKALYSDADDGFRSSTSEQKFDSFMTAVSRKLGVPTGFKQTSWRMNATTSGTFLYSECETSFSKNATATESFTWLKSGDRYKLHAYNISSDDLVTR